MKKKAIIALIITLAVASGCSVKKEEEHTEDGSAKESVILADGNTKSFFSNQTFGVEVDTEYEQKIDELNNSDIGKSMENATLERLDEEFKQLGVNGETTQGERQFIDETSYMVYGSNTATNLILTCTVNTKNNSMQVYKDGAASGSEYCTINGVDQLGVDLDVLLEYLYNAGIYSENLLTVDSSDGNTVVLDNDGEKITVDMSNGTVNGEATGVVTDGVMVDSTEEVLEDTEE